MGLAGIAHADGEVNKAIAKPCVTPVYMLWAHSAAQEPLNSK